MGLRLEVEVQTKDLLGWTLYSCSLKGLRLKFYVKEDMTEVKIYEYQS